MQSPLDILLQVEPMNSKKLSWLRGVLELFLALYFGTVKMQVHNHNCHTLTRMEVVELESQPLASCELFQETFPALLSSLAGGRAKVQEVAAMGENQRRVHARLLKLRNGFTLDWQIWNGYISAVC